MTTKTARPSIAARAWSFTKSCAKSVVTFAKENAVKCVLLVGGLIVGAETANAQTTNSTVTVDATQLYTSLNTPFNAAATILIATTAFGFLIYYIKKGLRGGK